MTYGTAAVTFWRASVQIRPTVLYQLDDTTINDRCI